MALSASQEVLLDEALLCIRTGVYRAAFVAAWAAFMDALEDKLVSDGGRRLCLEYPDWGTCGSADALREAKPEHQIIEAGRKLGLYTKATMKTLHGHLSSRNDCAHAGGRQPTLNQTVGFVDFVLEQVADLSGKSL